MKTSRKHHRGNKGWLVVPLGILMASLVGQSAEAASFNIKPIKIIMDQQTRIEKLVVKNIGEEPLTVQIKAYQWTQNPEGQDVYLETRDLIVFPKLTTIHKDEEKIIRVGTNLPAGPAEKTYRLFVEEIPSKEKKEEKGSNLHMYMKVGVPLFISPVRKEDKGAIEGVKVQKGKAEIRVRNQGNQHFIVHAVQVKGENLQGQEIFSKEINGWYVLNGLARSYELEIPKEVCPQISRMRIEVITHNNLVFKEQVPMEKAMCLPSI